MQEVEFVDTDDDAQLPELSLGSIKRMLWNHRNGVAIFCGWLIVWTISGFYGFGRPVFIVGLIAFMCTKGLGLGTRPAGLISPYSVFNEGFQEVHGTFSARQFERELLHRPLQDDSYSQSYSHAHLRSATATATTTSNRLRNDARGWRTNSADNGQTNDEDTYGYDNDYELDSEEDADLQEALRRSLMDGKDRVHSAIDSKKEAKAKVTGKKKKKRR